MELLPVLHERGSDLDGKDDVGGTDEEGRGPYCAVEVAEEPAFRSIERVTLSNCHGPPPVREVDLSKRTRP